MSSHDWIVVLITAAISLPISLLVPFGSDRIKNSLAGRSQANARRRQDEITAALNQIKQFKQEPGT
jgi:hypothetical protein